MKQSLMLLSGLLCDESFWADIPQRLAGVAQTTVVSFPGFSTIGAMARHVLDIAPQSFAVAGHSMGGRVALELMRTDPKRITGLALLNTSVHAVRDGEPQSRGHLLRVAYERGMAALAAEWLPPMLGSDGARAAQLMPQMTAMIERWTPDAYAQQVGAMLRRPDALAVLSGIAVPTLLLSGSDDLWSPVSQQQSIHRRIPHATLFEIHGAGHMAPLERPQAVARALREWLLKV
ncbi:MAG TPA: alpha/beta fold hydrolase [Steroidobacteraceae bacterium]|jgi:pimeloyl-ACP methyl ester carboxylesterase|nr:alpha/beta fold hydrolase [Steroidobacteraceae bacterium]